jgi:hypothetical protein
MRGAQKGVKGRQTNDTPSNAANAMVWVTLGGHVVRQFNVIGVIVIDFGVFVMDSTCREIGDECNEG